MGRFAVNVQGRSVRFGLETKVAETRNWNDGYCGDCFFRVCTYCFSGYGCDSFQSSSGRFILFFALFLGGGRVDGGFLSRSRSVEAVGVCLYEGFREGCEWGGFCSRPGYWSSQIEE